MNRAKEAIRWTLLLLGIVLFVIFAKSAMYRAWLAGGPPTPNPEGWLFSAWKNFSWSLAFISGGIGIFLLIGRLPSLSKVAIMLLAVSAILGILPAAREFLAVDDCLDAGGKWLYEELRCVYE